MRQNKIIPQSRTLESDYKPKISAEALAQVQSEMQAYCEVVFATGLSEVSKGVYIDFADKFVRWLAGDFTPGAVKDGQRKGLMRGAMQCLITNIMLTTKRGAGCGRFRLHLVLP
jgi:hypothetical protein